MLRAEEIVFPSVEPPNWLPRVKWSALHKNNNIWTEQAVFVYLEVHVCPCVCITSLKTTENMNLKETKQRGVFTCMGGDGGRMGKEEE